MQGWQANFPGDELDSAELKRSVAVLIPVKAFREAKQRLAAVLTSEQRAILARRLATGVVVAARPFDTFVVTGSDEIAEWATPLGAEVIRFDQPGLNAAVAHGYERLRSTSLTYQRVVISHGDLPLARHFRDFAATEATMGDPMAVVIGGDRHGDGTNVLSLPLGLDFEFRYGPGSMRAHQQESDRLGVQRRSIKDDELSWDVDRPEDLDLPEQVLNSCPRQQFPGLYGTTDDPENPWYLAPIPDPTAQP